MQVLQQLTFDDESFAVLAPLEPNLSDYTNIIVMFSGGKDSVACVLELLDRGVPPESIELHHHLVDGRESTLMDWPCTESYCEAFARHFGMQFTQSWREGGIEREMLRDGTATAPVHYPGPDGMMVATGGDGPAGTRRKFPALSASLSVRWCSSSAKIDCGARYLNNHPKFLGGGKTLVITGERAEESSARAKYAVFEPDRTDRRYGTRVKRWVDHWRPIHRWSSDDVWNIIKRFRVLAHPAYHLGFGRTSCMKCVFSSPNQWATIKVLDQPGFIRIANYEREFGFTIVNGKTVEQLADAGRPYELDEHWRRIAMSKTYTEAIIVKDWTYPKGAFGECNGPT